MVIFNSANDVAEYHYSYPIDELRLSHSTLQTFASCPRRFEFSKLFNNPKYEESTATRCGTALHEGFQDYLINRNIDHAIWKMMLAYPWEHGVSSMKDRSAESCYNTLMEMINNFDVDRYELAYIIDKNGNRVPCIELPFQIEFEGYDLKIPSLQKNIARKSIPITYVGFIDLVVFDKQLYEFLVIDIKTTTDKSEDQSAKFEYSSQCVPYSLVVNQILQLPNDSLRVGYYIANISNTEAKARLFSFIKTENDLRNWARDMEISLSNIIKYTSYNHFPCNGGSTCVQYSRRCKYYDLCHNHDNKSVMLSLFYDGEQEEIRPFEPLVTIKLNLKDLTKWNER